MGNDEPIHTEIEDLHETHVTHFQLTTTDHEIILAAGEMKPEIKDDGNSEISRVIYDTKLRMTHETAYQLKELLDRTFD